METTAAAPRPRPRVGLFATCLVDLMRPSIGFAAAKLIEAAGCEVVVPSQTCCGQPAFNSGDRATAKALAEQAMREFRDCDYVVIPSGSCGGMMAKHYPELFADDPNMAPLANAFAAKCHELVSFLVDVRGMKQVTARCPQRATYHDSCSGLRELGVKRQPRDLLASVEGLTLVEMRDSETCCGFGGMFAVKYGEISDQIVTQKATTIEETGADLLLAGDLGCLMNMAGKLSRMGKSVDARHVAEVLADMLEAPPIGAPQPKNGA
ncbi:MAG: (Fe-S)-binding protein [Rhizobiales bacterium]|nr:(Fe-S)-binding protein [Hyphomicrobiales bacterium]